MTYKRILMVVVLLSAGTRLAPQASAQKIYWTGGPGHIRRANLDGSNAEELFARALTGPFGLAVDSRGGKVYWTDIETSEIRRADLDGGNVEVIATSDTGVRDPLGIAVDSGAGKIYWVDMGTDEVRRANLDGSGAETLAYARASWPNDVAVDTVQGKVYWISYMGHSIQRANLDGSQAEVVFVSSSGYPWGIDLDLDAGKIYWTNLTAKKVVRANLDGTLVEEVVSTGLEAPRAIAVDALREKVYWTDGSSAGKIRRADLSGTNVVDFITNLDEPRGLAVDSTTGQLYWADVGAVTIKRVNSDGSDVADVVRNVVVRPSGITLDLSAGMIYWTDGSGYRIQRAALDGSGVEELFSGYVGPGICLDKRQDKMYWTSEMAGGHGTIRRADLNGANVETLLSVPVVNTPTGLALDLMVGRFYWTDSHSVLRSNLDGSEWAELLYDNRFMLHGIAFDPVSEKLYWTAQRRSYLEGSVQRANCDMSEMETIAVIGTYPRGVAIDSMGEKVYWADYGLAKVLRANLDGSDVESLRLGDSTWPLYIALDLRAPGDFDLDRDVDLADYAVFQLCYGGQQVTICSPRCTFFDSDPSDRDVDHQDFARLSEAMTGPAIP